jgi:hypothetical protein
LLSRKRIKQSKDRLCLLVLIITLRKSRRHIHLIIGKLERNLGLATLYNIQHIQSELLVKIWLLLLLLPAEVHWVFDDFVWWLDVVFYRNLFFFLVLFLSLFLFLFILYEFLFFHLFVFLLWIRWSTSLADYEVLS